jgi:hypothetical protein
MIHIKFALSIPLFCAVLFMYLLGLSKPASANIVSFTDSFNLLTNACPAVAKPNPELKQLSLAIATADSLDQALNLALTPTNSAIDALDSAELIMPFNDDIELAKQRLSAARARMVAAASQQQVADEFSGLLLAGLDNNAVNVDVGNTGCHYTSGETIAIVIGLILGIIPGLILLVLLC